MGGNVGVCVTCGKIKVLVYGLRCIGCNIGRTSNSTGLESELDPVISDIDTVSYARVDSRYQL